jgi:hypothetical protein
MKPSTEINWGRNRRNNDSDAEKKKDSTESGDLASEDSSTEKEDVVEMVEVVAWYTPMIPVNQGPSEYWGLPGLILEVSAGNVIMLCSKIVMNPEEKTEIEIPTKGEVVTRAEYNKIITEKMEEMRNNRGRGSGRRF